MTHLIGGVIGKVHVTTWSCQESRRENLMRTVLLIKMEKDRTTALGKIVWDQVEEILETRC